MPQPRVPTNILDARGAFKKNPKRAQARENEPQPTMPIGAAPGYFNDAQRQAWRDILTVAHPGVLCNADTFVTEMASVLLAEFRAAPADFLPAKYLRLQSLLVSFGMTPADRSRVGAPKVDKKNPFADLINRGRK